MHILLIHQVFLTSRQAGGTRHYEFARHCIENGHRVTVITSDVDYLTGRRIDGPLDEEVDGIRIRRARMLSRIHQSFVWRIAAFLTFMLTSVGTALKTADIDLVVGTSPPLFQAVSAWAVAAVRRKPLLVEIRDLWPDFAIDMGILKNPLFIWLARRLETFLYRRTDHILVNSPAYRDYLLDQGLPGEKISLIPNGVDPAMFDPAETGRAIREEFDLEGKFVVVYTGAIGPANDVSTLVRAAAHLQADEDVRLLIVGDGKDRPAVERLIAREGLTNVILAGPRPKSEMKQVLGAADACVATLLPIPMFAMTYPNKVFDYLAAGRPVVLAIDGVVREVVEKADAGIFATPGDDRAVARAISRLKADPRTAREMGLRGRGYVTANFDRNRHAAAFLALAQLLTERTDK
jgi:glycosyltransferase involved in cell wall biosynthesis